MVQDNFAELIDYNLKDKDNREENSVLYVFTVSELNVSIKHYLESNPEYRKLSVKGEISNFKLSPSGHYYFTLKDQTSEISCVLFKRSITGLKFIPENGQKIILLAKLSAYTPRGQYQLIVEDIRKDGMGDIFLKIEELKKKLMEEGLFDPKHKKEIPMFPENVAVITSPHGAAVHDIIKTFAKRNNSIRIIILPAKVQGEESPESIVKAIETANMIKDLDVIIIARGGGSIEDLMAFNSEKVARAVFDSELPVISAVGHQIDYLISDLVADLRASTPTEAAQFLTKKKKDELVEEIKENIKEQLFLVNEKIEFYKNSVSDNIKKIIKKSPKNKLDEFTERLDDSLERIYRRINAKIREKNELLSRLMKHLNALSPYEILERGYSITRKNEDGMIVRRACDINLNDTVETILSKGSLISIVTGIKSSGITN